MKEILCCDSLGWFAKIGSPIFRQLCTFGHTQGLDSIIASLSILFSMLAEKSIRASTLLSARIDIELYIIEEYILLMQSINIYHSK